jgi:formylmethanofuran dehydrogenase subunit E
MTTIDSEEIKRITEFHGHMCPGLAMGIRAAEVALREIGPHAQDEEVVAIVETDMCAVDAIQWLTGCTYGKGNLIHLDYGKNAFTFIRRSDGKAIRIVTRPGAWGEPDPEHQVLRANIANDTANEEEQQRFQALHQERSRTILERSLEALFDVSPVKPAVPAKARIHDSVTCVGCGEVVMETRSRLFRGQTLCIPCFAARDQRYTG